jgi:hypothetical protein
MQLLYLKGRSFLYNIIRSRTAAGVLLAAAADYALLYFNSPIRSHDPHANAPAFISAPFPPFSSALIVPSATLRQYVRARIAH